MGKRKKYDHYEVADLLCDESFQDWVLHPEMHTGVVWDSLSAQQTPLADHISMAKALIRAVRFKESFPSDAAVKAALESNLSQINTTEPNVVPLFSRKRRLYRGTVRAAIAVGILFGIYFSFRYLQQRATVTIETAYGETKTVTLPDSSVVILNAHASLTYPKYWRSSKTRELTLNGEGYFHVRHLNKDPNAIRPGERFIVHTGQVDVEVLGTSFDVKQKGPLASILLETGSVRLTLRKMQHSLLMRPGDRILYDASARQIRRSRVQAGDFISWIHHEMILKGENLQVIAQMLHDYYGVHIVLQGDHLEQMKMEGTLLLDSMPDVLFALSTAMNLKIEHHGDTIIIQKRDR